MARGAVADKKEKAKSGNTDSLKQTAETLTSGHPRGVICEIGGDGVPVVALQRAEPLICEIRGYVVQVTPSPRFTGNGALIIEICEIRGENSP